MGVLDKFKNWKPFGDSDAKTHSIEQKEDKPSIKADYPNFYTSLGAFTVSFDGEKNLGEIGPKKNYVMNYYALSLRAWQSYIESEVTQIIINKFVTWVIGKGLKLQSEPETEVLRGEQITVDKNTFSKRVESVFKVYSKNRKSSHSGMHSLNKLQSEAYKNAILGGDVLVVLRVGKDNTVTTQLIDGAFVQSPAYGTEYFPERLPNGNRVEFGVELNERNEHVAYHVRKPGLGYDTERIVAREPKTGMLMAYMVYGLTFRLDNVRGIPMITVVLETLKKLERYKEATVGSAEERQKIVYQIVHEQFSTGESAIVKQMATAFNPDGTDDLPVDIVGKELADKVAASTNKQTYNMPIGAEMKGVESRNELFFKDFYGVLTDIICAALEIPPNVAWSRYDTSYSSSRAALKDWELVLDVKRDNFSDQFNQPIYNLWLYVQVLLGRVMAPGYLMAIAAKNWMVTAAYQLARWSGAEVPHIDPLKEVMAIRAKLGETGKALPLITAEQATEALGGGDYQTNLEQYEQELKESIVRGVVVPEPVKNTPAV